MMGMLSVWLSELIITHTTTATIEHLKQNWSCIFIVDLEDELPYEKVKRQLFSGVLLNTSSENFFKIQRENI